MFICIDYKYIISSLLIYMRNITLTRYVKIYELLKSCISLKGLKDHRHLLIIIICTLKRFSNGSFITLRLISERSYLTFSIRNQYPIGVMVISFTLVKIKSKKSKIKKKFLQWHKCLNTYIQTVNKIHAHNSMNFYIVSTSNLTASADSSTIDFWFFFPRLP